MSTLTGDKGKIKVGYQVAAILQGFTIVRQQETLGRPTVTLTTIVSTVNGYWSKQRPFTVGLWMGTVWWVWTTVDTNDVVAAGATITIRLIDEPMAVYSY